MVNCKINKDLVPMKGHYFLFNAGTAPVTPFLSVFIRQLGFSSVIVGAIYVILPVSGMLAKPSLGAIADRFKCKKLIFLIMQLVTAAAFLGLNFVPEVATQARIHFACDYREAVMDTCVNGTTIFDSYAAENLKVQTGEGKTVTCELNCPMDSNNWDTICNHWNGTQYCNDHPDNLKFKAHVPMNLTDQMGSCVYFRVNGVTFEDGQTTYPSCPPKSLISSVCDMKCDLYAINELVEQSGIADGDVYYLYQFWLLLVFLVIGWVGQAIVVSIADAICFELLDEPNKYGYQRLFGAMGWGIFSIIAGLMIDYFSQGQVKKNYSSVFYLGVAMLILDFAVSYKINYTQKKISSNIARDIGSLLTNLHILVFMLWCTFMGMCTGLIWQFLFWLIEDLAHLQGPEMMENIKTLEGLAMAIQCLGGEMPFFFLSGWILKRIGHVNAMSLVLVVLGIRCIIYSLIANPWYFLPIELSNGLTFGLFYATMASYASIVAPPGTEATVQGMVGAVFEGVGVSLGSFVAGILFKDYGGPMTFRIFGIASLIAALIHALLQFLLRYYRVGQGKDMKARYAAPQDAINMGIDDNQELRLVGY